MTKEQIFWGIFIAVVATLLVYIIIHFWKLLIKSLTKLPLRIKNKTKKLFVKLGKVFPYFYL